MTYSTEWASALQDIKDSGTAVTFTRTVNVEAASTGLLTSTVTTTPGYAVEVSGNPATYLSLSLVVHSPATLLFAASTYGNLPRLGDDVLWAGVHWTVRDVNPVSPDTSAIITRVIVTAGADQPTSPGAFSQGFSGSFA